MPLPEHSPMSIAIDRAMKAAETDPLVEALQALSAVESRLRKAARAFYVDGRASALRVALAEWQADADRARAVLAKYRPQS